MKTFAAGGKLTGAYRHWKLAHALDPRDSRSLKAACAALVHLPGLIGRELPWIEKQAEGLSAPDLEHRLNK
jgi:hypothetical protein